MRLARFFPLGFLTIPRCSVGGAGAAILTSSAPNSLRLNLIGDRGFARKPANSLGKLADAGDLVTHEANEHGPVRGSAVNPILDFVAL